MTKIVNTPCFLFLLVTGHRVEMEIKSYNLIEFWDRLLVSKESCDLAKENDQLKAILAKDKINQYEFTEANKKLLALDGDNKPLDKKEIADIVYQIYHYPSDHNDIIKTMRHWRKRRNQQEQQQQQQQQYYKIELNSNNF